MLCDIVLKTPMWCRLRQLSLAQSRASLRLFELENSPERGVKALFFTYFAFVGVFSPYLALYFAQAGMTVAQIGVLMSISQILRIVGPPFWGWLADHRIAKLSILRTSAWACFGLMLFFPLVAGWGYWPLIAFLSVLFFMTSAQGPINEAMAVQIAAGDVGRYGKMRLWGSVGFIAAVACMGPVLDALGVQSLPYFMMAACAALVFACTTLVKEPVPQAAALKRDEATVSLMERFKQRPVVLFFLANGLMVFGHSALYVLFSLFLEQAGYTKTEVGLIWALSVLAEIVLFQYQSRLFKRFSLQALFVFSLLIATLRFAALGWASPLPWVLVLVQIAHAVTFGLHHSAAMGLLHQWFTAGQQARAQALYIVCSYGIGGTLGGLVASQLWVIYFPATAFIGAAVAAALGLVLAWLGLKTYTKRCIQP